MKVMINGKRFTQGAGYELNEKRTAVEYVGHENSAINEIHSNPNMTREEKLAAARAILNAAKEEAAAEVATVEDAVPVATTANDTRSKVCVIANNLNKQGMNRPEAFRKAWAAVKAATVDTNERFCQGSK
jgi:ribosomal protein L21